MRAAQLSLDNDWLERNGRRAPQQDTVDYDILTELEFHNRAALELLAGIAGTENELEVKEFDPGEGGTEEFYKKLFGEHVVKAGSTTTAPEVLSPVRDPYTDWLLGALAVITARWPHLSVILQLGAVVGHNLLFVSVFFLHAAITTVLLSRHIWVGGITTLVLLVGHTFVCGTHLALHKARDVLPASDGSCSTFSRQRLRQAATTIGALFAPLLLLDAAMLLTLPLESVLRHKPSSSRGSLKTLQHAYLHAYRLWRKPAAAACEWLWHYRLTRMTSSACLQAVPMVIYCALLLADTQTAGSGQDHALDGLQGILAACIVVAGLLIMCTFVLLLMNARASGGMPMLRYMSLVGNYSGSPHLPLDWQVQLSEDERLTLRIDEPSFGQSLARPAQVHVLASALSRPYISVSNTVQHPRLRPSSASPSSSSRDAASSQRAARQRAEQEAQQRRSCCIVLTSKQAVRTVMSLLPVPLALVQQVHQAQKTRGCSGQAGWTSATAAPGDFSVVLNSFNDFNHCKHCLPLLDVLLANGLRTLLVSDTPLGHDTFNMLARQLSAGTCRLTKLQLKDVLAGGVTTLCMLSDALSRNSSITTLDLANNQLWGVRGAQQIRDMLVCSPSLQELLLPFCGITSAGACEIVRGASQSKSLRRLDLSQNHIGDDVPWPAYSPSGDGSAAHVNPEMRAVDLSFNWIQDALAPWIIVLLEIFPHLSRLQLDHNADASASRAGSHQVSRTLTPRGQTGSGYAAGSMQQLHHGVASASAISTASGSMLQHSMHGPEWQHVMAQGQAGSQAHGRSRGQHLAAHLLLYSPHVMATIARMELLDLRGLPLPAWWARGIKPPSVLIDEGQVYVEDLHGPMGQCAHSSGMDLPHNVVCAMEAGAAEGVLTLDLMAPEYRMLSKAQQLTAVYHALSVASHVVISNTGMTSTGMATVRNATPANSHFNRLSRTDSSGRLLMLTHGPNMTAPQPIVPTVNGRVLPSHVAYHRASGTGWPFTQPTPPRRSGTLDSSKSGQCQVPSGMQTVLSGAGAALLHGLHPGHSLDYTLLQVQEVGTSPKHGTAGDCYCQNALNLQAADARYGQQGQCSSATPAAPAVAGAQVPWQARAAYGPALLAADEALELMQDPTGLRRPPIAAAGPFYSLSGTPPSQQDAVQPMPLNKVKPSLGVGLIQQPIAKLMPVASSSSTGLSACSTSRPASVLSHTAYGGSGIMVGARPSGLSLSSMPSSTRSSEDVMGANTAMASSYGHGYATRLPALGMLASRSTASASSQRASLDSNSSRTYSISHGTAHVHSPQASSVPAVPAHASPGGLSPLPVAVASTALYQPSAAPVCNMLPGSVPSRTSEQLSRSIADPGAALPNPISTHPDIAPAVCGNPSPGSGGRPGGAYRLSTDGSVPANVLSATQLVQSDHAIMSAFAALAEEEGEGEGWEVHPSADSLPLAHTYDAGALCDEQSCAQGMQGLCNTGAGTGMDTTSVVSGQPLEMATLHFATEHVGVDLGGGMESGSQLSALNRHAVTCCDSALPSLQSSPHALSLQLQDQAPAGASNTSGTAELGTGSGKTCLPGHVTARAGPVATVGIDSSEQTAVSGNFPASTEQCTLGSLSVWQQGQQPGALGSLPQLPDLGQLSGNEQQLLQALAKEGIPDTCTTAVLSGAVVTPCSSGLVKDASLCVLATHAEGQRTSNGFAGRGAELLLVHQPGATQHAAGSRQSREGQAIASHASMSSSSHAHIGTKSVGDFSFAALRGPVHVVSSGSTADHGGMFRRSSTDVHDLWCSPIASKAGISHLSQFNNIATNAASRPPVLRKGRHQPNLRVNAPLALVDSIVQPQGPPADVQEVHALDAEASLRTGMPVMQAARVPALVHGVQSCTRSRMSGSSSPRGPGLMAPAAAAGLMRACSALTATPSTASAGMARQYATMAYGIGAGQQWPQLAPGISAAHASDNGCGAGAAPGLRSTSSVPCLDHTAMRMGHAVAAAALARRSGPHPLALATVADEETGLLYASGSNHADSAGGQAPKSSTHNKQWDVQQGGEAPTSSMLYADRAFSPPTVHNSILRRPLSAFATQSQPVLQHDAGVSDAGVPPRCSMDATTSHGPHAAPLRLRTLGQEASMTVVLQVGASGLLWMPLRVLELPLRAAVLRRPGMAVSYKVSGVSHSAMRQLQSLMASTHPQGMRCEASRLWMLPTSQCGAPQSSASLLEPLFNAHSRSLSHNLLPFSSSGIHPDRRLTGTVTHPMGPSSRYQSSGVGLLDLPPLDLGNVISGHHISVAQITYQHAQRLAGAQGERYAMQPGHLSGGGAGHMAGRGTGEAIPGQAYGSAAGRKASITRSTQSGSLVGDLDITVQQAYTYGNGNGNVDGRVSSTMPSMSPSPLGMADASDGHARPLSTTHSNHVDNNLPEPFGSIAGLPSRDCSRHVHSACSPASGLPGKPSIGQVSDQVVAALALTHQQRTSSPRKTPQGVKTQHADGSIGSHPAELRTIRLAHAIASEELGAGDNTTDTEPEDLKGQFGGQGGSFASLTRGPGSFNSGAKDLGATVGAFGDSTSEQASHSASHMTGSLSMHSLEEDLRSRSATPGTEQQVSTPPSTPMGVSSCPDPMSQQRSQQEQPYGPGMLLRQLLARGKWSPFKQVSSQFFRSHTHTSSGQLDGIVGVADPDVAMEEGLGVSTSGVGCAMAASLSHIMQVMEALSSPRMPESPPPITDAATAAPACRADGVGTACEPRHGLPPAQHTPALCAGYNVERTFQCGAGAGDCAGAHGMECMEGDGAYLHHQPAATETDLALDLHRRPSGAVFSAASMMDAKTATQQVQLTGSLHKH